MSTHQKSLKNNKKNIFSMKTLVENTNKCSLTCFESKPNSNDGKEKESNDDSWTLLRTITCKRSYIKYYRTCQMLETDPPVINKTPTISVSCIYKYLFYLHYKIIKKTV
jgi:hypothetical protein